MMNDASLTAIATILGAIASVSMGLHTPMKMEEERRQYLAEPKLLRREAKHCKESGRHAALRLKRKSTATALWNSYFLNGWLTFETSIVLILWLVPVFITICLTVGSVILLAEANNGPCDLSAMIQFLIYGFTLASISQFASFIVRLICKDRREGQIELMSKLMFGTTPYRTFYGLICNICRAYRNAQIKTLKAILD